MFGGGGVRGIDSGFWRPICFWRSYPQGDLPGVWYKQVLGLAWRLKFVGVTVVYGEAGGRLGGLAEMVSF